MRLLSALDCVLESLAVPSDTASPSRGSAELGIALRIDQRYRCSLESASYVPEGLHDPHFATFSSSLSTRSMAQRRSRASIELLPACPPRDAPPQNRWRRLAE